MSESATFAGDVLLVAVVGLAAVLSNRVTERIRVPAPVLMLVAAAIAVLVVPELHAPPTSTVEHLVSLALVLILFDGGMGIGWARFRSAAAPIAATGILGTFLTAAGIAVFAHLVVGLDWYAALLLATAVAPTDPAVVFSVLGNREVSGRSGTLLEGESGANDPVGIALMASLLSAGSLSAGAFGHIAGEFALQMVVGAALGYVGGRLLLWFMRAVPLPGEGLYPLRTLACAFAIFGATTLLHGSGFLAVFVAGIVLGDARAPYKREIEHFHTGLASLGEIVAFVALGLTVRLGDLADPGIWVPGLAIGIVLAVVVRPLLVGPMLAGSGLSRRERAFVLLAGLKGAVPILLGSFVLASHVAGASRLYGIVVVVVVFSVVMQGSLVPTIAHRLGVPMRRVEPEPWALGVRLRDEPGGVHRLTVAAGSPADGTSIQDLDSLPEDAWVSFIVRAGRLLPVHPETVLQAGDETLVLGPSGIETQLRQVFERPA